VDAAEAALELAAAPLPLEADAGSEVAASSLAIEPGRLRPRPDAAEGALEQAASPLPLEADEGAASSAALEIEGKAGSVNSEARPEGTRGKSTDAGSCAADGGGGGRSSRISSPYTHCVWRALVSHSKRWPLASSSKGSLNPRLSVPACTLNRGWLLAPTTT
jgi:hypothetical protein